MENKSLYFPENFTAWSNTDDSYGGMLGNIAGDRVLKVKQGLSLLEAFTQGCCEKANVYKVYSADDQERLTMVEDSECFNRCCCAPIHTYKMQLLGPAEGGMKRPDDGWESGLQGRPVLMYREGCCSKFLCCFSMTDMCANHAEVLKAPGDPQASQSKYKFEEKLCNGCTPEIVISSVQDNIPVAMITGPSVFGGCYELCADFDYTISSINPATGELGGQIGDIAIIKKKKPEGCCALLTEAFTDVDNFEIAYTDSQYNGDPEFKAVGLAALIYLDFMFFEFDNGLCEPSNDGGCTFTFFNCYCCGTICPCSCTVGGSSGEGE